MRFTNLIVGRFPPPHDLWQVFLVSVFPVAIWSWLIFIYNLPSFLRSMRVAQILGVFAYMQMISLLESLLFFVVVTLLAVALPGRIFLNNYVPQATLLVLVITFWAVGLHLYSEQVALGHMASNPSLLYYWTVAWGVILLAMSALARFKPVFNVLLLSLVDRVTFVSSVYLFFALISLPIVILRNLIPA